MPRKIPGITAQTAPQPTQIPTVAGGSIDLGGAVQSFQTAQRQRQQLDDRMAEAERRRQARVDVIGTARAEEAFNAGKLELDKAQIEIDPADPDFSVGYEEQLNELRQNVLDEFGSSMSDEKRSILSNRLGEQSGTSILEARKASEAASVKLTFGQIDKRVSQFAADATATLPKRGSSKDYKSWTTDTIGRVENALRQEFGDALDSDSLSEVVRKSVGQVLMTAVNDASGADSIEALTLMREDKKLKGYLSPQQQITLNNKYWTARADKDGMEEEYREGLAFYQSSTGSPMPADMQERYMRSILNLGGERTPEELIVAFESSSGIRLTEDERKEAFGLRVPESDVWNVNIDSPAKAMTVMSGIAAMSDQPGFNPNDMRVRMRYDEALAKWKRGPAFTNPQTGVTEYPNPPTQVPASIRELTRRMGTEQPAWMTETGRIRSPMQPRDIPVQQREQLAQTLKDHRATGGGLLGLYGQLEAAEGSQLPNYVYYSLMGARDEKGESGETIRNVLSDTSIVQENIVRRLGSTPPGMRILSNQYDQLRAAVNDLTPSLRQLGELPGEGAKDVLVNGWLRIDAKLYDYQRTLERTRENPDVSLADKAKLASELEMVNRVRGQIGASTQSRAMQLNERSAVERWNQLRTGSVPFEMSDTYPGLNKRSVDSPAAFSQEQVASKSTDGSAKSGLQALGLEPGDRFVIYGTPGIKEFR